MKEIKHDFQENQKTEELVTRKDIPNTPFIVITTEEGSFGTLGKYRLTEIYKTENECMKELEKVTWNRIIQVMSLVNQIFKDEQK